MSIVIGVEFAIGLADRFGLAGEELVRTFTWMACVAVETIARDDVPAPDEASS